MTVRSDARRAAVRAARLAAAHARRTIRPAPSRWSCPIRRAAASTRWRASWRTSCRSRSASRSWSTIAAAAAGLVGTRAVMKAAPDGYTLLLGHTGSISINPSLYANAGFDPRKDFAADRADRLDAGGADRASVVPGEDDRRLRRARQKGSRQAQHRHLGGRHRRLHVGRAVQGRQPGSMSRSFPTRERRR